MTMVPMLLEKHICYMFISLFFVMATERLIFFEFHCFRIYEASLLLSLLYMSWQPGESLTYPVKLHALKTQPNATVSFPRSYTDRLHRYTQANGCTKSNKRHVDLAKKARK